MLFRLVQPQRA